jgi:hypothetical protein
VAHKLINYILASVSLLRSILVPVFAVVAVVVILASVALVLTVALIAVLVSLIKERVISNFRV